MEKRVLIITYYWPPSGGPGVQRWLKFSKYLPDCGIKPIILTVHPDMAEYPMQDESLLNEIRKEVKVIHTKTWEPFHIYKKLSGKKKVGFGNIDKKPSTKQKAFNWIRANLFVPDARKYWKNYAVKAARKAIREDGITTIITTGPPHSTHLIGLALKKENRDLNWIADFRDPWSNFMFNENLPRTNWAKRKDANLEQEVRENANHIVVVHDKLQEKFSALQSNVHLIHNGYDTADFRDLVRTKVTTKFTLTYIGNFRSTQNLAILWKALKKLKETKVIDRQNFKFKIAGMVSPEINATIAANGLNDLVDPLGYLAHKEALQEMMESNLLYISIPEVGTADTIVPGKTFEYLYSEIPLLAVAPADSSLAMILKRANRNAPVGFNDLEEMTSRIQAEFSYWSENAGNIRKLNDGKKQEEYSRESLTKRLKDLIV